MANLDIEKMNEINFDDETTVCDQCGAFGVFLPPSQAFRDTIKANFKCNNGHFFTKVYPLKNESTE
jgi:hypothetical protein